MVIAGLVPENQNKACILLYDGPSLLPSCNNIFITGLFLKPRKYVHEKFLFENVFLIQ